METLMQKHGKSFTETIELLVQCNNGSADVVERVSTTVSEKRYKELLNYVNCI